MVDLPCKTFLFPIVTGYLLFACFQYLHADVRTLPHSYDTVLLLCCWSGADFIDILTLETDLKVVTPVHICVSLLNEQRENILTIKL